MSPSLRDMGIGVPTPNNPNNPYSPYFSGVSTSVHIMGSSSFGFSGRSLYPTATKPPKHEGIKVGEIIAWRAWRICERGLLISMMVDYAWHPRALVSGTVDSGLGVHAWKQRAKAEQYCHELGWRACAIGTIALWGELHEHEWGYRAQYARIASIDKIWGSSWVLPLITLRSLQNNYGVGFSSAPPVVDSKTWTG